MRLSLLALSSVLQLAAATGLCGQCTTGWLPGGGLPGVNGTAYAVRQWDPDGPGPLPPRTIVGGAFSVAGAVATRNIAAYDPVTDQWSALGAGVDAEVHALCTLQNGDLIAAGDFQMAGGIAANYIARWDGTAWSPLGSGTSARVRSLAAMPNGDLAVGGWFGHAGGMQVDGLARWDGSTWSRIGTGTAGITHALLVRQNGNLVASRAVYQPTSITTHVGEWDGAQWTTLGGGIQGTVNSLATLANGEIVFGGTMSSPGTDPAIRRWNGSGWVTLGLPPNDVQALLPLPNGDLLAVGSTMNALRMLMRWNGAIWSPVSTVIGGLLQCLDRLPGGETLVGGQFNATGLFGAARWNGATWLPLGSGWNGPIDAFTAMPNGDVVAGGWFTTANATSADFVARWDGTSWSQAGAGLTGPVSALAVLANGDLVAAEAPLVNGGVLGNRIVRWDGTTWSLLSAGPNWFWVNALLGLPNGDLVAGGSFTSAGGVSAQHVARWNGTGWSPMGAGLALPVNALARLPNGDVVAATGGGVHRFDGANWSALGAITSVYAILVDQGGHLFAGTYQGAQSWDGTSWSPLGSAGTAPVYALAMLPNGDLVAGGNFTAIGATSAARLARWDGSTWLPFGAGIDRVVTSLCATSKGDLMAGGYFALVDGAVSAHLAHWTASCPGSAAPYGSSCAGTAGTMSLTAVNPPWAGGTFRSASTGMAPASLGMSLVGFTRPNAPLSALHPAGVAGCQLLASAEAARLLLPSNGIAAVDFAVPRDPGLAGVMLHHQMLQLEVAPLALLGSNGLLLTVGTY